MSRANTPLLTRQISTIKFDDGANIKYPPQHKLDKMLGVQINNMLDFRDHLRHVTDDVRQLEKILNEGKLSPNRKNKSKISF
jgi:hypothetical protein